MDILQSNSDPVALLKLSAEWDTKAKASQKLSLWSVNPYTVLEGFARQYSNLITIAVEAEVRADEGMTACALERYRLANGCYPDALEKLVPTYLKTLPRDAAGGGTLHYRLKDDGQFLLYSVGINGQDDGGKEVLNATGSIDRDQSDWVW